MSKKIILWIPVFAWMLLIFTLSSIPSLPGPGAHVLDFFFKKSAHMTVYGILYLLIYRAFERPTSNKAIILMYVICIIYAFSDEIHQSFVPGRTPNLVDVGFDSIGISVAYLWTQKYL